MFIIVKGIIFIRDKSYLSFISKNFYSFKNQRTKIIIKEGELYECIAILVLTL